MATVPSALVDPNFQGLPPDQKKLVLGKLDPNFASLPSQEQDGVLAHGAQMWTQKNSPAQMQAPQQNAVQNFGDEAERYAAHPEERGEQPLPDWLSNFGSNFIRGTIGLVAHPMNTIQSMAQSLTPQSALGVLAGPTGTAVNQATNIGQGMINDPGGTAAQLATGTALGEVAGGLAKPISKLASAGRDIVTGGTKAASDLNTSTAAANDAAALKANEANAKIQSARTQELSDHLAAIQKAKGEAPTTLESGRPRNARELQSHKEALNRGVEQLDTKFQDDLKNTARDAKEQLDTKYDTVRQALSAKTGPDGEVIPAPTVASPDLAAAVHHAESNLMGSTENIKQFRDILSKHPESDPDFVNYQGAEIPRGHPLYDIIKGDDTSPGATFRDLQGYYSELGDKLASGGMLGDVYQATKSLHDSIGEMMQKMAQDGGVDDALNDAQTYARDYYSTWRDPSSPLYKAIKAPERGGSIAQLQGKDVTGIQALARYNAELAKRANTIRAYRAEAQSIPNRPFAEKPVSALGPTPETITPNFQTIGPEDIENAKAQELQQRTQTMQHYVNRAALYITGYRGLTAVGRALAGDTGALAALPADITEGMALMAGGNGLAKIINSPKVSKLLTAPTPADVAQISPEIARDLAPIVEAAKKQGVKISPAVTAAISAHSTKSNWYDQPQ